MDPAIAEQGARSLLDYGVLGLAVVGLLYGVIQLVKFIKTLFQDIQEEKDKQIQMVKEQAQDYHTLVTKVDTTTNHMTAAMGEMKDVIEQIQNTLEHLGDLPALMESTQEALEACLEACSEGE